MTSVVNKAYKTIDCGNGTQATLTAHNATVFDKAARNPQLASLSGQSLVQILLEEYPGQIHAVNFTNPKNDESSHAINNTEGFCKIVFDMDGLVTEANREYAGGYMTRNEALERVYADLLYNRERERVFTTLRTGDPEKTMTETSKFTDSRILGFMQDALKEKDVNIFFTLQEILKNRNGYTPIDAETIMETKYIPAADFNFTKICTIFNFQSRRVVENPAATQERAIPFSEYDQQALEDMRDKLIGLGGKPREISTMQKTPAPVLSAELKNS